MPFPARLATALLCHWSWGWSSCRVTTGHCPCTAWAKGSPCWTLWGATAVARCNLAPGGREASCASGPGATVAPCLSRTIATTGCRKWIFVAGVSIMICCLCCSLFSFCLAAFVGMSLVSTWYQLGINYTVICAAVPPPGPQVSCADVGGDYPLQTQGRGRMCGVHRGVPHSWRPRAQCLVG
jgi:hypothetical protein